MYVELERKDHIAIMTLNRPEKLNSFNAPMQEEIWDTFHQIEKDPEIRAAILKGEGRAFCTGADLKELERPGIADRHDGPYWRPLPLRTHDSGWEMSKPLIAAIHGYCLAGGLEVADWCDIRICTEDAQFGCPEVRWNVLHGYGAARLTTMIGMSDAMLLLLTGRFIPAAEALRIGLVSKVLPDREALLAAAMDIAQAIASNGPIAVQMTKQLAQRGRYPIHDAMRLYQEYQRVALAMEDAQEGNIAFAERRDPVYKGR